MPFTAGQRVLASQLNQLGSLPAAPVSTAAGGTPTTGATEVLDIVLGTYQFTAVAGTRYTAIVNGILGGSTAGELYRFNIRDSGSASAPTSASTVVASTQWYCPATGGPGQSEVQLQGTFTAGATAVHTIGVFCVRLAGANVCTPGGTRELYVMATGTV